MMERIINRLKSILARGIIQLVNDEGGRQLCQVTVLAGEVKENVDRIQQFGFTSNPPAGTAAIIGFIGADRGKPVILGDNNPEERKKGLNAGESAAYDAFDQYIYLKNDGSIEIQTNGLLTIKSADKVFMETELLEVTGGITTGEGASIGGSLTAVGDITDRNGSGGISMSAMRGVYDEHDHDETQATTQTPNQEMGGH